MAEQNYSRKELRELRKMAEAQNRNNSQKQNTIKWVVLTICSLAFVIFFVGLVMNLKQQKTEVVQEQLSNAGWVRGASESAKLTLTEFSDLQCPSCAAAEPYIQEIIQKYPNDVKFVYRHFPLPLHKNSTNAAKAAEAAGVQGKFWEMHDVLFTKQTEWENEANPKEKFASYAKELNLDIEKYNKDFDSGEIEDKIKKDNDEALKLGVNSTPTFYINGKKVSLQSLSDITKLVDDELGK